MASPRISVSIAPLPETPTGGEDSLGTAGWGQAAGESDGGGRFRALEGDGEQVDQGVDGERVVVAVFVEQPAQPVPPRYSASSAAWIVSRRHAGDAEGRDVVSSGKGGAADLADGEFADGGGPFEPGLDVVGNGVGDRDGHGGGDRFGGAAGRADVIRPRPGVMSMRMR